MMAKWEETQIAVNCNENQQTTEPFQAETISGTTEVKISGVTYVVSTCQSERARETLKAKLERLILETARKERKDLSEE